MAQQQPLAVLFVCLGNICRSTMAEGVFRSIAKSEPYAGLNIQVDSCGTAGYHSGETPDDRTMSTLEKHGINDYQHRARKLSSSDFDKFDYVFAMDRDNLRDIQRVQHNNPDGKAKVMLFGEYHGTSAPKAEVVSDPYYGGAAGFERVYDQVLRFSKNFLEERFPDLRFEEEQ